MSWGVYGICAKRSELAKVLAATPRPERAPQTAWGLGKLCAKQMAAEISGKAVSVTISGHENGTKDGSVPEGMAADFINVSVCQLNEPVEAKSA